MASAEVLADEFFPMLVAARALAVWFADGSEVSPHPCTYPSLPLATLNRLLCTTELVGRMSWVRLPAPGPFCSPVPKHDKDNLQPSPPKKYGVQSCMLCRVAFRTRA